MAKLRLDRIKPLVALGAFLFAWWIIPTTLKSFLEASFSEFQAPAWVATSYLDDLENFWARRSHSKVELIEAGRDCLLYTSPSPRDVEESRMPSSA